MGRGRLAVGALVLVGGAVVLLGANGAFGGAPMSAQAGANGRDRGPKEVARGAGGPVGTGKGAAKAMASAGAEAREAPQPETAEVFGAEASRSEVPKQPDEAGGGGEPGMVAGTTATDDVLAGGPDPRDGEDYKADGPSRHTDRQAAEYFRANWGPDDKALKRLKDIRTVGGYLRIYTDLPESADNSLAAITLCERGLAYLYERGVANPVVFVQAKFGGNGNPVLANILGPSDRSCRVTHPVPD